MAVAAAAAVDPAAEHLPLAELAGNVQLVEQAAAAAAVGAHQNVSDYIADQSVPDAAIVLDALLHTQIISTKLNLKKIIANLSLSFERHR